MADSITIDVNGARVLFETNSKESLSEFLSEYGWHRGEGGPAQGRLTVTERADVGFNPPQGAIRIAMQFPANSTYMHDGVFFLIERGRFTASIDPSSRHIKIEAVPGADIADRVRYFSKRLLVKLLEDNGFAWMHGAAVSSGGGALAFTGPSGSGKTTCLLTMLEGGSGMVTDDVILFKGGMVHPIRLRSMIHRSTMERFASLRPLATDGSRWVPGADGVWADLGRIYRVQASPVPPKAIFNTYVWNSEESSCKPCPPNRAIPKLIKNYVMESGWVYEPTAENVKGFFSAYAELLDRVPCHDLYVGRDSRSLKEAIEGALR